MASTEAQKRASRKWQTEKTDELRFRVLKGEKAEIEAHADQRAETLNAFLRRAVRETMQRDEQTES